MYDVIGLRVWQTVFAMLRQFFNDIKTDILSIETSDFLSQMIFLESFNSVFSCVCPICWMVGINGLHSTEMYSQLSISRIPISQNTLLFQIKYFRQSHFLFLFTYHPLLSQTTDISK